MLQSDTQLPLLWGWKQRALVRGKSCLHGEAFHQVVKKPRRVTTADWLRRKGKCQKSRHDFWTRFEVAATSVTFGIRESHFWAAVGWILWQAAQARLQTRVSLLKSLLLQAARSKNTIRHCQPSAVVPSGFAHWGIAFLEGGERPIAGIVFFVQLWGVPSWQSTVFKHHHILWGGKLGGWVGLGSTQWGLRVRWRKTVQRSQRSARRDRGSVGRPQRHTLSGCGMTAQAQLVLDARVAVGRSVQVIKPFKHSSTHRHSTPAAWMNVVQSISCFCWTLIALMLLPPPSSFPSSPTSCPTPQNMPPCFLLAPNFFFFSALIFFFLSHWSSIRIFSHLYLLVHSFKDVTALPLESLHHSNPSTPTLHPSFTPPHSFPHVPTESEYYLIPLRRKGRHTLRGWLPRSAVRHGPGAAGQTSVLLSVRRCQQVRVRLGQAANESQVCWSGFESSHWCGFCRGTTWVHNIRLWGVFTRSTICHCFGAQVQYPQFPCSFLNFSPKMFQFATSVGLSTKRQHR